jgi:6-pyruvoyltetrahydropterin/6-carboxytetrahydropterin synthase
MKTRICKSFTFDSAHTLKAHGGKCGELHGHTYKLEVYLEEDSKYISRRGLPILIDFSDLKKMVENTLLSRWDHKDLNKATDLENPTAEILALLALNHLRSYDKRIYKVRLWETPTSWAEVEIEQDKL